MDNKLPLAQIINGEIMEILKPEFSHFENLYCDIFHLQKAYFHKRRPKSFILQFYSVN